jgi:hypothetical protein
MAVSPGLRARLRQFAPWLIGLAIVAVIATRVPFAQFRGSLGQGPHLALAAVELLLVIIVLGTDSLSTWLGLLAVKIRWPLAKVAAVRGATFLLFLLNYAVGHGGFGYYLYRSGVSSLRATGATLFLIGTNLATLLVLTFAAWAITGAGATNPTMWWSLIVGNAAFVAYLVVIALRPGFLARRELFAPLFDAGLRGHAFAIVGRLPHVTVVVMSYWVAMRVWGIPVPLGVGATLMPAVALATVLPISPAGLGTTQAALVFFFRDYAAGATADERTGALLAFGIVHFVYSVAAAVLVGFLCLPLAKRSGAIPSGPDPAAASPTG